MTDVPAAGVVQDTPAVAAPSVRVAPRQGVLIQATLMTLLAGFVDAVGYGALGHLYLSFMSGNSTQLGMAVARLEPPVVGAAGAVVAAFVAGAFLGALIMTAERLPVVFAAELGCFAVAWAAVFFLPAMPALLPVALAMGMQNAAHVVVARTATGKSFVTGALYGVGDALARACVGRARVAEARANALSWLAFVAGVVAGAVAVGAVGVPSSLVAGASMLLFLLAFSLVWHGPAHIT